MLYSNKNFWLLTLAEIVSQAGNHFRTITVVVFTFNLTNLIFITALQFLFNSIPGFVFSNYAGRWAEKVNPRLGMIIVHVVCGILTLLYPVMEATWAIFLLNLMLALAGVFGNAFKGVWLPRVVGTELVTKANGIRTSLGGVIDLVFPIVGGLVILWLGTFAGFVLDSLSFLLAAIGFAFVRPIDRVTSELIDSTFVDGANAQLVTETAWSFIKSRSDILFLLIVYGAITFSGQGISVVFLPFLESQFHIGSEGYGTVISAFLLGNVLSGFTLAKWGDRVSIGRFMIFVCVVPFAWIGYMLVSNFVIMLALVVVDGCISIGAFAYVQSVIQSKTPDQLIARVFAFFMTLHFGSEVLGTIVGGGIAQLLGFTPMFLILFAVTVVIFMLSGLISITTVKSRHYHKE
ncbi:MFS family permease [Paenibacillus favisporus]|uniref:MFS family permease n=1 Tax=Paenibacillus favisporus TaxID=221028 RepID=A0ABV2EYV6_9BACL